MPYTLGGWRVLWSDGSRQVRGVSGTEFLVALNTSFSVCVPVFTSKERLYSDHRASFWQAGLLRIWNIFPTYILEDDGNDR